MMKIETLRNRRILTYCLQELWKKMFWSSSNGNRESIISHSHLISEEKMRCGKTTKSLKFSSLRIMIFVQWLTFSLKTLMNLRKTDYQKRQKKKELYGFLNLPQVHVEKASVYWTKTPPFLPTKRDSSFPSTFQILTSLMRRSMIWEFMCLWRVLVRWPYIFMRTG